MMKRVTLIFEDEFHKKAKIEAIKMDMSLKQYVTSLIEKDLSEKKKRVIARLPIKPITPK